MKTIAIDIHGVYDSNHKLINRFVDQHRNMFKFVLMSGGRIDLIRDSLEQQYLLTPLTFTEKIRLNEYDTLERVDHFLTFHPKECKLPITYQIIGVSEVCDTEEFPEHWFARNASWWVMKSVICDMYGVDALLDNRPEYRKYFGTTHPTKFIEISEDISEEQLSEIMDNILDRSGLL